MQVTVRDARRYFNRQTHAYAEYRAFSRLASDGRAIERVAIALARVEVARRRAAQDDGAPEAGSVLCQITVELAGDARIEVQAIAPHPHAAIDRAVALIGRQTAVARSTTAAGWE